MLHSINIKTIFKNVGSLRSSLEKRKALQVKLTNEEDMLDEGFKDLEEALEKEKEVIRKINDENSLYQETQKKNIEYKPRISYQEYQQVVNTEEITHHGTKALKLSLTKKKSL